MKHKMIKPLLLALAVMLSGCGSDNAYDGTGLIGGTTTTTPEENAMLSVQTQVFQKHATALKQSIAQMRQSISTFEQNLTAIEVSSLQRQFETLMTEWKSVEAGYVAADYDESLIDTPSAIDFFHTGNVDVASDAQAALDQTGDIEAALFKNSSKTITALEYMLFGTATPLDEMVILINKDDKRRLDASDVALKNLEAQASKIETFYQNDTKFAANLTDASNALANVLIDSSFKLKEWRIGEPSGIAQKYAGNPESNRFEYAKSKHSLEAMRAILLTHQEIMGEQSYANFGSFASQNGAQTVVVAIRKQISDALALLNQFNTPIEEAINGTSVDAKIDTLYATTKELQQLYYESLIQALNLTAEIIEADGD